MSAENAASPSWLNPSKPSSTFDEMRRAKRWLLHKGKVPYYVDRTPRRGALDGPEDTARFSTYEHAKQVLSQHPTFDGLGFALGDGWQGIDLDKITDTNQHLAPLVADLPGYVEHSPSGKGVHAIGRGEPFDAIKGNGIEVYSKSRFFTVTEQTIQDAPITDLAPFVTDRLVPLTGRRSSQSAAPQTIDTDQWAMTVSAIEHIPADCSRDEWIRIGMALHTTGHPEALSTWQRWSEQAPDKFPGESKLMAQWRSFHADKAVSVSLGTIFAIAKGYGWESPQIDASSLPWSVAAEDTASTTTRRGDQAPVLVPLADIASFEPPPPSFRMQDLMPQNEVTLLAAHGGVGKTALALHMAICLAMGLRCMGKDVIRSRVMLYSAEDSANIMQWRIARECKRLNLDPRKLATRLSLVDASEANPVLFHEVSNKGAKSGQCSEEYERLRDLMKSTTSEVLIIDNASDVYAADENSRPQVRAFLRSLRKLVAPVNGAVMLLVHVDKATARQGNSSEGYSGSTAWHNSVRSRLYLSTNNAVPDGLMLEQKKNNRGPCSDPIVLQWTDGMLMFKGAYIEATNSDADIAAKITEMIGEYYGRGEFLSTSPTAHTNPYKLLSTDPDFPKVTKARFNAALRSAERNGLIQREDYRTQQRKTAQRWQRVETAPSALSCANIDECAKPKDGAPPAPSWRGLQGGERAQTGTRNHTSRQKHDQRTQI